MRILRFLLLTFFAITAIGFAAGTYLSFRHPFIIEEIFFNLELISKPEFDKPISSIRSVEQLDAFIASQLDAHSVPGAAVAIVADGKVQWSNGYGFANVDSQAAATADTPFMLGSVSKSVTGIALMHAVESGALDLDADINAYLSFPVVNPQQPDVTITLRHLATHTSGIVDHDWTVTNSYGVGDPTVSLEAFLQGYLVRGGADFRPKSNFSTSTPGQTYEYSNVNAGLAGHILHAATGQRLDAYTNRHLFEPLGMDNTGWFLADFDDPSQIAQPYARGGSKPLDHYGYPTWPDGQLRASANDLARLLAAVGNGGTSGDTTILSPTTVEQMLARQSFPGLAPEAGEGIFWSYTKGGHVGHNGGDFGVMTFMMLNPETGIGAVVLTNANPGQAVVPAANIVRQILESSGTVTLLEALASE